MTNHNYHSTAEHSYQEGRAFSWNRRIPRYGLDDSVIAI